MSTNNATNQAAAANDTPSILGKRKRDSNSQCHYERDTGRECRTKRRITPKETELTKVATVTETQSVLGKRKRDSNSQSYYEEEVEAGRLYSAKRRMTSEEMEHRRQQKEQEFLESKRQYRIEYYRDVQLCRDKTKRKLANPANLSLSELARYRSRLAGLNGVFVTSFLHTATKYHKPERCQICKQESCSICLEPLEMDQQISFLRGCTHSFHTKCVNRWLKTSSDCPNCRNDIYSIQLFIDRV